MNIKRFSLIKDILMFFCLIMLMLTPYLLRVDSVGRNWEFLGWWWHFSSWHMLFGVILTVLFLIHIAINFKWLTGTAKAWKKANAATKAKFWMMILVCIFMSASIITGIIWGLGIPVAGVMDPVLGMHEAATLNTIQFWHTITSWAAFYFTGIHIGLHLQKFLSFTAKPKPKAPAPAPKPAE